MRLFVACELPAVVRKSLAVIGSVFDPGSFRMKWVEEQNLHVTMKFLGDVPEGKLGAMREALGSVAFGPFTARVSGAGIFPPSGPPRVLWAGLEPPDAFVELHVAIDDALEGIGFGREMRFSPHVTLARVRSAGDAVSFRESASALRTESSGFDVGGFVLRSSVLTPSGPVYSDEAVFRAHAQP